MELENYYNARKELQNQVKEVVDVAHNLKEPDIEDAQYMGILENELRLMAAKIATIREEHIALLQRQFCEPEDEVQEEEPQVEPESVPAPAQQQPADMIGAIVQGLGAFASAWTMYQQHKR